MAKPKSTAGSNKVQPPAGTVITPGGGESQAVPSPAEPAPSDPVPDTAAVESGDDTAEPPTPAQAPEAEPEDLQFDNDRSLRWTASEFIAHDKTAGWYALLAVGTATLALIAFLIMRDLVSVSVVIVAGVMLGVYAGHKPRQQEYTLSDQGLNIGDRHYGYTEFKWFSIVQEGAFSSIVLMPNRRFVPLTTVYYDPKDEDRVLAILSNHLPMEEHTPDAVDSLMRRIRF